ncbi:MAG: hypothetical protein AAF358_04655 [Pseudomonadota bacterium]
MANTLVEPLGPHEFSQEGYAEAFSLVKKRLSPAWLKSTQDAAATGDPGAAYLYSIVLRYCAAAPENLDIASRKMDGYLRLLEENPGLESSMQWIEESVLFKAEHCQGLPPRRERIARSFDWFVAAADGGHMLAMLSFYKDAIRQYHELFIRNPDMLYAFHERSREYINRLLETGHPEAFELMALAIHQDIVFQYDGVRSLAFLLVANQQGLPQMSTPWSLQDEIESTLSIEQQRLARELADEICERYCVVSAYD